jgi:hypothetical protein|tara:strand:+ start:420 stop:533 length:114 start_codon:yes stop_codon:yes gene_type:complete
MAAGDLWLLSREFDDTRFIDSKGSSVGGGMCKLENYQ